MGNLSEFSSLNGLTSCLFVSSDTDVLLTDGFCLWFGNFFFILNCHDPSPPLPHTHTRLCTHVKMLFSYWHYLYVIPPPKVINLLIDPAPVFFPPLICCHGNTSDPAPVLPSHLYLSCPSAAFSAVFKESYAPLPLYSLRYVITSFLFWIISTTWLFWFNFY